MDAKPYKIPHPFRKLSKELIDKIVQDVRDGSPHSLACESNGITVTVFNMWRRQGRIDLEFDIDSLPAYLVVSLAKCKQKEVHWCRNIIKESDKGHKGAEWTLEHAYQRQFSASAAIKEFGEQLDELTAQKELLDGKETISKTD